MPTYAKLRSDLVSSKATVGDAVVYTVKDPITGTYFRLREPEYWLINQLDGESAPDGIAERFKAKFGLNITAEDVKGFITTIEGLFFLETARAEQQVSRKSYAKADGRTLIGRLLYIKLKAFDPGRFLDWLTSVYRRFHNRFWFTLQIVIIAIGFALLMSNLGEFHVNLQELLNAGSIVMIVLALFILIVVHEFAHAIMCRYHGGQVKEIGFLLMYFQPCFYADLSDAWLFEKKSQRLAVTWAGPYSQFILLAVAIIIWRVTIPGSFVNQLAQLTVMVSWVTFLFNFNPLLKLDGYYLLSDWVDIPNLRRKAFSFLGNVLKRRLLGWLIEPITADRRERRIFAMYSLLAVTYSGLLLGYILYVVAKFLTSELGGFGLILLFVLLLVILRDAIARLAKGAVRHIVHMKSLLKKPIRLAVYLGIIAVVLILVLAVPFPHRVSGEVTVQPLAVFTLTLNEFGMLESLLHRGGDTPESKASLIQLTSNDMAVLDILPLVEDGQEVTANDTLAILTSSQVTHEIAAGQAELERLQGELALLKAPPKKEQIAEAEAEVRAAKASYDRMQREFERSQELAEKNLIADEELEEARSAVEIARAELANKESALELLSSPPRPEEEEVLKHQIEKQESRIAFLKRQAEAQLIVAPFSGVVSTKHEGEIILTLADNQNVELLVPVSDFEIADVNVGQTVRVKVRSFPHLTFFGKVVRIPKSTNEESACFPVSVVLKNEGDLLNRGMTGYAKIDVGNASLLRLAYRKLLSNLRVEFWSWW
jgi:putative peptide zinc metalloprotease protein